MPKIRNLSIIQIDMCTNNILNKFKDVEECAKVLKLTYGRVYQMCEHKRGLKRPQLPYYLRYEKDGTEPHTVYEVYDEDFELLKTYYNIAVMSEDIGLTYTSCIKQMRNNRGVEMRNRFVQPKSGLYLVEKEVK